MFTVSDIIHLIQYYYHTSSYDNASADVETFRLESLRGNYHFVGPALMRRLIPRPRYRKEPWRSYATTDPRTSQFFSL